MKWLVAIALMLAAVTTSAHAAAPCSDFGTSSSEWIQCDEAATSAANAKLAGYLQAAEAQLRKAGQDPAVLLTTQEAWVRYRKSQCGDVYLYWVAGTYRYQAALQCNLELTRQRTHDLWSAYLTFMDSTPPILPEP